MKRLIAGGLFLLAFSILAVAHGGEEHVMGIVTKIDSSSIAVQTTTNKTVIVAVNDKTEFSKGGVKARLSDLKEGDRVVIHAKRDGERLVARTVKVGMHTTGDHKGMKHQPGKDSK